MKNKVLKSYNNEDESTCVDIFVRSDGSWGFEQYRRDFEEGRWFPISNYGSQSYPDEANARQEAAREIPWFKDIEK